jgi:hypothetical protein
MSKQTSTHRFRMVFFLTSSNFFRIVCRNKLNTIATVWLAFGVAAFLLVAVDKGPVFLALLEKLPGCLFVCGGGLGIHPVLAKPH